MWTNHTAQELRGVVRDARATGGATMSTSKACGGTRSDCRRASWVCSRHAYRRR